LALPELALHSVLVLFEGEALHDGIVQVAPYEHC
jgi:hypothetical protein